MKPDKCTEKGLKGYVKLQTDMHDSCAHLLKEKGKKPFCCR